LVPCKSAILSYAKELAKKWSEIELSQALFDGFFFIKSSAPDLARHDKQVMDLTGLMSSKARQKW